jgi:hypothetical protein
MHRRSARVRRIYACSSSRRKRRHRSALRTAAVRCFAFLFSAFLSALETPYKWSLINSPFVHVYVTRCPDLLTSSHSRSPQVTSRPVGPPSLLSCGGGKGSDGGRVDLLTLSSQSLCIRRETLTDVRHQTQRTQPHAHLGTRRRDPSHTVCCEPNWKGCLRTSF